jgi:hypothetical protein
MTCETLTEATGQSAIRRLFKAHGKRQYRVGHMFFSREVAHPLSEWHFVFFETKELKADGNHWEGGAHVHITNYLWPNLYCQTLWEQFVLRREFPKTKLHLACIDNTQERSRNT